MKILSGHTDRYNCNFVSFGFSQLVLPAAVRISTQKVVKFVDTEALEDWIHQVQCSSCFGWCREKYCPWLVASDRCFVKRIVRQVSDAICLRVLQCADQSICVKMISAVRVSATFMTISMVYLNPNL